jgi:hypothetical protein
VLEEIGADARTEVSGQEFARLKPNAKGPQANPDPEIGTALVLSRLRGGTSRCRTEEE